MKKLLLALFFIIGFFNLKAQTIVWDITDTLDCYRITKNRVPKFYSKDGVTLNVDTAAKTITFTWPSSVILPVTVDYAHATITPSSTSIRNLATKIIAMKKPYGAGGSGGDASATNQSTQITNEGTIINDILRLQRAVDSLKANIVMSDIAKIHQALDSLKANITIANTGFTANAGTNLNTSALGTSANQATQIAIEKAIYTRDDSIRQGTGNTLYASNTNVLRLQRAVDSLKTNVIGAYGGMLDVLRLQRAVDSLKANITITNTAFTANAGTNLNTSAIATTTNVAYVQRAIDSLKTNVIGAYGKMFDVLRLQRAVDSLKTGITSLPLPAGAATDGGLTTINNTLNGGITVSVSGTPTVNNGGYSFVHKTATDPGFSISGSSGILHTVVINQKGTGATLTLYNAPNSSDPNQIICIIDLTLSTTSFTFDATFNSQLYGVIAGASAGDLTITYR